MADNFILVQSPSGLYYVDIEDYSTSPVVVSPGASGGTSPSNVEGYGRERMQIGGRLRAAIADVLNAAPVLGGYGLAVRQVPNGVYAIAASGTGSATVTIAAGSSVVEISAISISGGGKVQINSQPAMLIPANGSLDLVIQPGSLMAPTITFTAPIDSYYVATST